MHYFYNCFNDVYVCLSNLMQHKTGGNKYSLKYIVNSHIFPTHTFSPSLCQASLIYYIFLTFGDIPSSDHNHL